MPVPALEGDKTGSSDACDGLGAGCAPLGKQFTKAVSTVGLVIPGSEPLASEALGTVGTGEALPVPGVVAVGHASLGDHLTALDALGSKLLLIALGAVDVVLLGDEALGSDGVLAGAAHETLLVPLTSLVLHLLHTCFEDIPTSITPGSKLGIIAWATVDPVSLASKLLVNQTGPALVAEEAGLVPVLLFIGEVLGVDANDFAALITVVGEDILIALDAVGVVVSEHVPVSCKTVVTVVAKHALGAIYFL